MTEPLTGFIGFLLGLVCAVFMRGPNKKERAIINAADVWRESRETPYFDSARAQAAEGELADAVDRLREGRG